MNNASSIFRLSLAGTIGILISVGCGGAVGPSLHTHGYYNDAGICVCDESVDGGTDNGGSASQQQSVLHWYKKGGKKCGKEDAGTVSDAGTPADAGYINVDAGYPQGGNPGQWGGPTGNPGTPSANDAGGSINPCTCDPTNNPPL